MEEITKHQKPHSHEVARKHEGKHFQKKENGLGVWRSKMSSRSSRVDDRLSEILWVSGVDLVFKESWFA